jgi:hypothetical protein
MEEQITQWSNEKVQKDKQRSTKHTHKTKDRVTRTPLKTEGELRRSREGKQFNTTAVLLCKAEITQWLLTNIIWIDCMID